MLARAGERFQARRVLAAMAGTSWAIRHAFAGRDAAAVLAQDHLAVRRAAYPLAEG